MKCGGGGGVCGQSEGGERIKTRYVDEGNEPLPPVKSNNQYGSCKVSTWVTEFDQLKSGTPTSRSH